MHQINYLILNLGLVNSVPHGLQITEQNVPRQKKKKTIQAKIEIRVKLKDHIITKDGIIQINHQEP